MHVDQVAVTMSPQHFKGFVKSLNETLAAYEKVFGALTIPDSDVQPASNAEQIETRIYAAREANKKLRDTINQPTSSSSETKLPAKRSRGARKAKES